MKKRKLITVTLGVVLVLQTGTFVSVAAEPAEVSGEPTSLEEAQLSQTVDGFVYEEQSDGSLIITDYIGTASNITVPSVIDGKKVTTIGEDAFAGYEEPSKLTSVVISDGITTIGSYAFAFNESLVEITIPDSVTRIGRAALKECGFSSIRLPSGLTSINNEMFTGCANLTEVIFPEGLTTIGESAFEDCTSLSSIAIPNGVELIDLATFSGCTNLKTIQLPASVNDIGAFAFWGCTSLKEINLPNGVTDIGADAFADCSSLESLKLPYTINRIWSTTAFSGCAEGFTLVVYEGSYPAEYAQENGYAYSMISKVPYRDVNYGDWFYDFVSWAYDSKLMSGYDSGYFGPADTLTRGQFAIIFHRYDGSPEVPAEEAPFLDVAPGLYYTEAISWAKMTGVVGGYSNGNFGPNDSVNREQIATMMMRYADYKGYDISARADLDSFPDAGNVSDYAQEAMEWAVAEGLITGDNGALNPQGNSNRAVAATIVNRFTNAYGDSNKE